MINWKTEPSWHGSHPYYFRQLWSITWLWVLFSVMRLLSIFLIILNIKLLSLLCQIRRSNKTKEWSNLRWFIYWGSNCNWIMAMWMAIWVYECKTSQSVGKTALSTYGMVNDSPTNNLRKPPSNAPISPKTRKRISRPRQPESPPQPTKIWASQLNCLGSICVVSHQSNIFISSTLSVEFHHIQSSPESIPQHSIISQSLVYLGLNGEVHKNDIN